MKKSGAQKAKFEIRKSKIGKNTSDLRISNFEFRVSNPGLRASDLGPRTLIIGYGNPLRSDDGFGWHAGRLLAQSLADQDAKIITCHQLTPELAETLSQSSRA